MPINITPLYTGRDSAAAFPDLDKLEGSLKRKQDLTLRGEEMRLDKTLKDREAFMKLMEVDPVMAVSLRGQEQQAKDLEAYNNKGAEIMRRTGGRPSEADRMEMLREKALLQVKQNKILGNQKMWEEARQTIARDTRGYYDRRAFEEAQQRYFETGEFTPDALQVAPQDITGLLSMDKPQNAYVDDKGNVVKDERGNVLGYSSMEFKRTREEAQEQIFSKLQSEPVLKFVIREFEKAPAEEQMKYLKDYDSNKNGKIDPDEEQYIYQNMDIRSNPIVQWAMNNERYIATSMGGNPSVPKSVPQGKKGSGFFITFGGKEQEITPGYKRNESVAYGDKIYRNSYRFPNAVSVDNVSTNGGIVYSGDSSESADNGNIQGVIKDYVADGNGMLIIEVKKAYSDLYIPSGGLVGVPLNNIPDWEKLPIKDESGNTTTLGELRGKASQPTAQTETPAQKAMRELKEKAKGKK